MPGASRARGRLRGRHVLENDERVDVLVARLIATKRFAARPKDAEDVRLLEGLKAMEGAE